MTHYYRRATALRASILVSLGIVPLACGGAVREGGADSGQGATAGNKGQDPGKQLPPTGTGGRPATGGGVTGSAGSVAVGTGGSGPIGTSGSGPTSGGATSTSRFPCTGQFLPETGLVECAEGYSHRAVVVECQPPQAAGGASYDAGGAGGDGSGDPQDLPRAEVSVLCQSHEDCRQYQWGYCDSDEEQAAPTCHSGCTADADCGPGAICECGFNTSPSGGVCRSANCRVDSDCGPGLLCATYATFCGYGGFACQSVGDQCASTRDCGGMGSCYLDRLSPSSAGRLCESVDCGRPFLVESVMRVASTVRDDAWSASLDDEPDVESLSAFERATQVARWTRMGQLEHASIAAFARFSLQLLSLGAPSELVEACTSALADETQHAKLCFRLASAYAGHALGPGRLDVSNSLASTSLGDIVDLVIAEGCFGETIATLDAQEAAEEAADPVIAAVFGRIARDEQRHAELAFGFLRWALEREPALVRSRIVEATESTFDHNDGAREVVVPCLLALLRQARAA